MTHRIRAITMRGGVRAALVTLFALAAPMLPAADPADGPSTILADLSPEVSEALAESGRSDPIPDEPRALLERIFQSAPAFRFRGGPFTAITDRRWFATEPRGGAAAPSLVVRRWPGDSVLALYVLRGDAPQKNRLQEFPDAKLDPRPSPDEGSWRWEGTIDTPFGPRPALWIERRNPGAPVRMGALLLPGDAGLGFSARWDLTEELLAALDRVEVDAEAADARLAIDPSTPIQIPRLDSPFGEGSERADPWQVVEGNGFTLGIPPGFRSRRLDLGVVAPTSVPGGLLWLRGRFVDKVGEHVAVGDGSRAGYVAEVRTPGWSESDVPPLGAPGAKQIARESFHAIDSRPTGAQIIWAERWRESGFAGEWLVFRLLFPDRGIEIGLPVLRGRQAPSLYWIPLTWRGPGRPPAEPPVDPAERFGISFERFTKGERRGHPWGEGYLRAPGLRLELPRDWWPAATLRSENGFPIRIVGGEGTTAGQILLLGKDDPRLRPKDGGGWKPVPRPSAYRASGAWARGDGARLLVTQEGYGFLLEPVAAGVDATTWQRMVESALIVLPRP